MNPHMLEFAEESFDPESDFYKLLHIIEQFSRIAGIGCYEFTALYRFVDDKLSRDWSRHRLTTDDALHHMIAKHLDISPQQTKVAVKISLMLQQ